MKLDCCRSSCRKHGTYQLFIPSLSFAAAAVKYGISLHITSCGTFATALRSATTSSSTPTAATATMATTAATTAAVATTFTAAAATGAAAARAGVTAATLVAADADLDY